MADCIFCRISEGQVPCQTVFESDTVIAFPDLHPQAPVHVLIMPRQHIATLNELPANSPLAAELFQAIQAIARQTGVAESGYRVIANTNRDGGQEVFHLHLHLLGGQSLGPMVER